MIVIGLILAVLAVLLIVVGALAFANRLPGNSVIGIRVAEVRKSKDVWDAAHHVAGPFWVLGGVSLGFAALIAFIASGWMWVLPVILVIVAVAAVGAGANVGARTAAVYDVRKEVAAQEEANAPAPAPKVDLDSLRRAAAESDD